MPTLRAGSKHRSLARAARVQPPRVQMPGSHMMPAGLIAAVLCTLAAMSTHAADGPIMGLAYQPYVGQWSTRDDNPFAPGRRYTPAFDSYRGGISPTPPPDGLWSAYQHVSLRFDDRGRVSWIDAHGGLTLDLGALRDAGPSAWSRSYFRAFEGTTPSPARLVDHRGSVYRQLEFLVRESGGAPMTLTTYGTGFEVGYWRRLGDEDFVVFPVWAENRVDFFAAGAATGTTQRATDELYVYFPPEATWVIPAPERIIVETTGTPEDDLALAAVHLRIFEPAEKGAPGAVLNPGLFLGDANAQVALAAAEINAGAGKTLLRIKQGVPNILVDGTLINPRMRFAIRSALAQAQAANERHPGTVTHLIVSNEYAEIVAAPDDAMTPTRQVTEMLRFARAQMAPGADFEGLGLALAVRSHGFRGVDSDAADPAVRRFTDDVRELIDVADVLMENIYPSPEALEQARDTGRWDSFFDPEHGELSLQWRRLQTSIARLAGRKDIALMIGEIGHPTDGIGFNLPGYVIGGEPIAPESAFARVAAGLSDAGTTIDQGGIDTFRAYFNDRLSAAFIDAAWRWSRDRGVQIHVFEAFDEPHKSNQNLPLAGLSLGESTLSHQGSYGAEGSYGIFAYSGVAGFSATPEHPVRPGSKLVDALPGEPDRPRLEWAPQFSGSFYRKLSDLDFRSAANAFVQ
jgi:exo-beta-1,3-glucanase (GH17 family)